jgi:hypothetical protein
MSVLRGAPSKGESDERNDHDERDARQSAWHRDWVTRGGIAAGRGIVLFGFTLASLVLWTVLLIAVALIPLGVGLLGQPDACGQVRVHGNARGSDQSFGE